MIEYVFNKVPEVSYEYRLADNLLILTSAKIGTNTIKWFFQNNNIEYIEGSVYYDIESDTLSEDNNNDSKIDVVELLQKKDIKKIILFRNPRKKALSGIIEDYNISITGMMNIPYGSALLREEFNIDDLSLYIMQNSDINIEHLSRHNPDLYNRMFYHLFRIMVKQSDVLDGHAKPVCKDLFYLLESGKIKVNENDVIIDLDDNKCSFDKELLRVYPNNVDKLKSRRSNKKLWKLFESEMWLSSENKIKSTEQYRIFENRINGDMYWYTLLKEKWQTNRS